MSVSNAAFCFASIHNGIFLLMVLSAACCICKAIRHLVDVMSLDEVKIKASERNRVEPIPYTVFTKEFSV